jgi:hypothetical protein
MMTMVAFNALLGELGRKIAWDVAIAALPNSSSPPDKDLHPLAPVSDETGRAQENSISLAGFVGKLNSMNSKRRLR